MEFFEVRRLRSGGFVVFGMGHHEDHMMDWAGLNMHHGRLPRFEGGSIVEGKRREDAYWFHRTRAVPSSTFATAEEARAWLVDLVARGWVKKGLILGGHHAGDDGCRTCTSMRVSELLSTADLEKEVKARERALREKARKTKRTKKAKKMRKGYA